MMWAARNGHLNVIKYLAEEHNVDVSQRNNVSVSFAKLSMPIPSIGKNSLTVCWHLVYYLGSL